MIQRPPKTVRSSSLVLASISPRRRAILEALAVPFETIDPSIDEAPLPGESPLQIASRLADAKARTAAALAAGRMAVGADTVVAIDGEALGKPSDPEEAWRMLRLLRGREHQVITGVAAARDDDSGEIFSAVRTAIARVWMRGYTDAEIEAYIARREPFDKAGGYAIQDETFRPCKRIEGCYLTVVGLPIPELCAVLAEVGVSLSLEAGHLEAACALCASAGSTPTPEGRDRWGGPDGRYGTCSGALARQASRKRTMRGSS